jgi:DNA-binding protein HU-beta
MNKAELIDVLTKKLDTDRRTATEAVENVVDTIVRAVHKGDSVTITGFGVFEQRRRAARVARNPRTGETVKVKPTSVPAFRPGAQFKAVVSGAQRLSAEGPAVKRGSGTGTARKAAKKTAAKKAVKRSPAKKAATKRTAAKKATKRSPAKKAATKRTAAKKATKRSPAKKATATKRTAAKKTAKRAPAKKATKRAAAKKATKRSPAKKAVRRSPAKKGRR